MAANSAGGAAQRRRRRRRNAGGAAAVTNTGGGMFTGGASALKPAAAKKTTITNAGGGIFTGGAVNPKATPIKNTGGGMFTGGLGGMPVAPKPTVVTNTGGGIFTGGAAPVVAEGAGYSPKEGTGPTTGPGSAVGSRPTVAETAPPPVQPKPPVPPVKPAATATTGLGSPVPTGEEITDPNDPRYTGREDSAYTLANEYGSQDSLLMQNAGNKGFQLAASRGMLNSSFGIGAAQAATLDYVVPLASQDASQAHDKNMSGLGTQQEQILAQFDRETQQMMQRDSQNWQGSQNQLDRELEREALLSQQNFEGSQNQLDREFEGSENSLDREFERETLASTQNFEASMQDDMQSWEATQSELDRDFDARQNMLNRRAERLMNNQELNAADRNAANSYITNATNDYNNLLAEINRNPDLSATERASQIEAAQDFLSIQVDYVESLYSAAFEDWPKNPFGSIGSGAGGGNNNDGNGNSGSGMNGDGSGGILPAPVIELRD